MLLTYDLKCQPQDKCLPSLSTLYSHSGLKETHYHSWQQILDKYPAWKGCYSKGWIKHVRVKLPNSARGFHPKSFCPSGDSNISNSSQPDDPKNCKHRFLRSPTWWLMVLCNYFAFWVAVPFNLLNLLLNQLNYKGTHCFFLIVARVQKIKKTEPPWATIFYHVNSATKLAPFPSPHHLPKAPERPEPLQPPLPRRVARRAPSRWTGKAQPMPGWEWIGWLRRKFPQMGSISICLSEYMCISDLYLYVYLNIYIYTCFNGINVWLHRFPSTVLFFLVLHGLSHCYTALPIKLRLLLETHKAHTHGPLTTKGVKMNFQRFSSNQSGHQGRHIQNEPSFWF